MRNADIWRKCILVERTVSTKALDKRGPAMLKE